MTTKKTIFLSALVLLAVLAVLFVTSNKTATTMASDQPKKEPAPNEGPAVTQAPNESVEKSKAEAPTAASTAEDLNKVQVLNEILESKNDNDPRMDTEFKSLSENQKKLIRERYQTLKAERFNEKGTVIFILGRNLKTKEDFEFLADVLSEPPCRNMSDCSAPPTAPATGEAAHEESINLVTLNYPQIVTLKALDTFLASRPNMPPEIMQAVIHDFEAGTDPKNPMIADMAQEIGRKYNILKN